MRPTSAEEAKKKPEVLMMAQRFREIVISPAQGSLSEVARAERGALDV